MQVARQALEYTESQLAFIDSFRKALKMPDVKRGKTKVIVDANCKDNILIAEHPQPIIRRSGRTTAFIELVRQLFLQREVDPVSFGQSYGRLAKREAFPRFLYLSRLFELDDILGYLRSYLMQLYWYEAANEYSIAYLILTTRQADELRKSFLLPFPVELYPKLSHFFRPMADCRSQMLTKGNERRPAHYSVVIVSAHCIQYGHEEAYGGYMRDGTEKVYFTDAL